MSHWKKSIRQLIFHNGELVKNKTVLIIAHRMRMVLGADKIIVIKDGVIAEIGIPLDLKENRVFFQQC